MSYADDLFPMNVKLIGSFIKHLEVLMQPGEEFYAERGAVVYAEDGIEFNTELTGTSLGKIIGSKLSGESLFLVKFRNVSRTACKLGLGSHAGILPIKLEDGETVCRSGAFMASSRRVDIDTKFSIAGFVGGMGALLQRISGTATVFLQCYGDPVVIDLVAGQTIQVDENHFLAVVGIPQSRMSPRWSAKNFFGGEGLSMLALTGPGRVYLNP